MDLMNDNEVLGVIGHEIGHVALKHTKKEMQAAMVTSAGMDVLASTNQNVAILTQSQLGAIGETILNAQYSKKQESAPSAETPKKKPAHKKKKAAEKPAENNVEKKE